MRRRAIVLRLLGLLPPAAAHAQPPQSVDDTWTAPRWAGHVTFLGANAMLGGLTAGIAQRLRGGSFSDGFTRGALGGAVAYAGRRIAAERFDGAGLLGRQVGAVGASVVRNASERRPSLERLFFPAGPLHVYWDRGDDGGVQVKVDGCTLAVLLTAIYQSELEFDLGRSLSAGAPVFWAPGRNLLVQGEPMGGFAPAGVILLSGDKRPGTGGIFAHERMHVLQRDFLFYSWGGPLEGWALRRTSMGSAIYRYFAPGVTADLFGFGLTRLMDIDRNDDPIEVEAGFLART